MGMDWGGCLHSRAGVRPGKLVRKLLLRAIASVDRAGENRAAWAKATKSAGVMDLIAACAVWDGGVVGALVGRDRCHSLVVGSRCPVKRMLLARAMVTCSAVNCTVHPASQNWSIDRREGQVRAGTMCTHWVARGSMGRLSSASCIEVIMLLLGLRIVMGVTMVRWLMTGVVMVVKWAVLPVSAIAMFGWVSRLLEGGPTVLLCDNEAAIKQYVSFDDISTRLVCTFSTITIGSPLGQLEGAGAGTTVAGGVCRSGRPPPMMMLLPPIQMLTVAVSWCPWALLLHVGLVWLALCPRLCVQQ
jgi:hypothetical protein